MVRLPLKVPKTKYEIIYLLLLLAILIEKGTGIVISVPSDSLDDYAAFMDLKNKPNFRSKLQVKDEWVSNKKNNFLVFHFLILFYKDFTFCLSIHYFWS